MSMDENDVKMISSSYLLAGLYTELSHAASRLSTAHIANAMNTWFDKTGSTEETKRDLHEGYVELEAAMDEFKRMLEHVKDDISNAA